MSDRTLLQESISYRGLQGISGLEVIDAAYVSSPLSVFNLYYGLTLPGTWQGRVTYERQGQNVAPGQLFCNVPGTAMSSVQTKPGSLRVLTIGPEDFKDYLAEHLTDARHLEWNASLQTPSRELVNRLCSVFSMTKPESHEGALTVQTAVVLLFASIAQELVKRGTPRPACDPSGVAQGVREWLHDDVSGQMDLQTFADAYGVSRFQVLRAFKRRYGLPPHAYQLCLRIALAREMLKRGETPIDTAAQLGFADQSHFGRHFKRLTGTTPGRYASRGSPDRVAELNRESDSRSPRR